MAKTEKLTDKQKAQMTQRFKAHMSSDGISRLVGGKGLKELVKAIDPDMSMKSELHAAVVREVGVAVYKAMMRCRGNNRKQVAPIDL